jgi:hypothetical protein
MAPRPNIMSWIALICTSNSSSQVSFGALPSTRTPMWQDVSQSSALWQHHCPPRGLSSATTPQRGSWLQQELQTKHCGRRLLQIKWQLARMPISFRVSLLGCWYVANIVMPKQVTGYIKRPRPNRVSNEMCLPSPHKTYGMPCTDCLPFGWSWQLNGASTAIVVET